MEQVLGWISVYLTNCWLFCYHKTNNQIILSRVAGENWLVDRPATPSNNIGARVLNPMPKGKDN